MCLIMKAGFYFLHLSLKNQSCNMRCCFFLAFALHGLMELLLTGYKRFLIIKLQILAEEIVKDGLAFFFHFILSAQDPQVLTGYTGR